MKSTKKSEDLTIEEIEKKIARMGQRFLKGCILSKLLSSEIALKALSISITTKTVKDRDTAFLFPVVK